MTQSIKQIKICTATPKSMADKDVCQVILALQKENQAIIMPGGKKLLKIGIDKNALNTRKLIIICRQIISLAKSNKIKKLAIKFQDFKIPQLKMSNFELAELLATNFEMANFEFIKYKTPPKEGWNFVEEIVIYGNIDPEIKKGFGKGQIIGNEINNCRALSNTPGSEMTPAVLARYAIKNAKSLGIKTKILNTDKMKALKMNAILSVAKGSSEKPKFIILEYNKGGDEKPIVLVGKGVTFDSGGINLKPNPDVMSDMHMDMSGAAAIISAIMLAAKLKIKKNIVGLVPAVENMPSGSSYRPGDILKTMSGKTIEVLNTDAEGRITLADALTYAERYAPKLVIDVATLTSASMFALGRKASAIFTRDEKLESLCRNLGEKTGDFVWPLPLWEEFEENMKSAFADIANVGKEKYGDASAAAIFLYQFAKDFPLWLHIDIAPTMTTTESDCLAKGASGAPIRLLIKLLEDM